MRFVLSTLALFLSSWHLAGASTIPSGTELAIRLTTPASSLAKNGTAVSAVVTTPVFLDGVPKLGSGVKLTGKLADVKPFRARADSGTEEQPATLRIEFNKVSDSGSKALPISCVVTDVDNARETVDPSGLIVGIRASETFGSQIDRGVKKLGEKYGDLGELLSAVKGNLVQPVDPSIDLPTGVDLTVKLTKPLDWQGSAKTFEVGGITPADTVAGLATAEPFRTLAGNPPTPSDMTNLMFIGTREQLQSAFDKAGWFSAAALSKTSKMETARAIIENRGYKAAPMSVLTLEGQIPELTLQKQTDTFAKRHHVRIWLRPERFNERPVWVAAGTHDISMIFSQTSRSFAHGIDPNIDGERSKIVNDLLFADAVRGIALVDRPDIPKDASNATGDKLITDGKIAVIELK